MMDSLNPRAVILKNHSRYPRKQWTKQRELKSIILKFTRSCRNLHSIRLSFKLRRRILWRIFPLTRRMESSDLGATPRRGTLMELLKKLFQIISNVVPAPALSEREALELARLNPDKFYVENVRSILGVS